MDLEAMGWSQGHKSQGNMDLEAKGILGGVWTSRGEGCSEDGVRVSKT